MRKSLCILPAAVVVGGLALVACSSKKPNSPIMPTVSFEAGIGSGADAGDAGGEDAAVPTGPTFFTGDAGAPAVDGGVAAVDGGMTPAALGEFAIDSAIDIAIATNAPKVAPKMDKEGQTGRATLKTGEHFNMVVTFAPNRCYTLVGFSPTGNVTQLDLKLYGPLPLMVEAGKSGANDKAMPVIAKGAGSLCPILPIPASYKVDAVATKGAGRIGVQLFARSR